MHVEHEALKEPSSYDLNRILHSNVFVVNDGNAELLIVAKMID